MTAINWANPVNGDWNVASDWSTDTVPGGGDDVTISAAGPYIVTVGSARTIFSGTLHIPILSFPAANSLTFNASEAALEENTGKLTVTGALNVNSGFVSLNEANTIGSVNVTGGVLALGNGGALGTAIVTISGGELLGTANETLDNSLGFSGTSTIAAAHGTALNETGNFGIGPNSTLNFGRAGEDGVIIWNPSNYSNGIPFTFNVVAGTLRAGGSDLSAMMDFSDEPITVDAGATLDLGGFGLNLSDLLGAGALTDSGAAATLTLDTANFSGAVSGPLSLLATGAVVLSGANTYTGTTTITSAGTVQLGDGGATGSIGEGAIADTGALTIDRNNAVALTGAISGAGALKQVGTGVTTINKANTYTGGTTLSSGTLAIGNGDALGTGAVSLSGGELLATANETVSNAFNVSGSSTVAAAHGTTLNLESSNVSVAAGSTLNFGSLGEDGVVVWDPTVEFGGGAFSVNVVAGTLEVDGPSLENLISFSGNPITVDAGATLDLAGTPTTLPLLGDGSVIDSGAATTLTLTGANFSGAISGALSVEFDGDASLSGLEDTTGGATLSGAITVANSGTYDIVANTNISGTPASLFINNGLFEKTGGGGVSDVTTNFINGGTLNVLSGSIAFSGGFTNNGVIHGLVRQSGGVTTVSAAVPSDFNGDALSDLLWQDTSSGQAAIWDMNGSAVTSGGALSPNPGPAWKAIGSADFNGDGHSDILWQNTNGEVSIWEMTGSTQTGGGAVSPNPGPAWKAIGTGDFNGDGLADILFQNTSTSQLSIWEMNGNKVIGGGTVGPSPGSAWTEIGTGDFNGDGKSDILWQNAGTGQLSIWEMNGNDVVGGGAVSMNPGPSWKAIGTGDFNGDGLADILFQNASTGQLSIWEMNGDTLIGGGAVSANPGLAWQAIGTGDFNGDGHSDILFQNTSTGQAMIWEMNGTNKIGGGVVSPNPGLSWHPVLS